jgi:DNA-binding transcriptional regulator YbjK
LENIKDEIKRLEELIEKWRTACQEALIEIKSKILTTSSSQEITIRHLLHHFQIDPKKLNYDEETDSFL